MPATVPAVKIAARLPVVALASACSFFFIQGCATKSGERADRADRPAVTPAAPAEAPAKVAEPAPSATAAPHAAASGTKPWVTQPVSAEASPGARSVAEALKDKGHPERLSMMIQPKPFSAEAYAKDPKPYLDTVEPGRVFQTAQPGPQVPQLAPASALAARLQPNGSVVLAAKTLPGQPVSWSSLDLGSFDNQLNAITVAADAEGIARITFTATPGVSHIVHIIAGSPVASGQLNFQVDVQKQGLVPLSSPSSSSAARSE